LTHSGPLMQAISASSIPIISSARATELSNIVWAFAWLAVHHVPLFLAISASARPKLRAFGIAEWQPLELSGMAWALARRLSWDPPLRHSIASAARRTRSCQCEPCHIATTLCAISRLQSLVSPVSMWQLLDAADLHGRAASGLLLVGLWVES